MAAKKQKKMAAALAAVSLYLEQEEAAIQAQQMTLPEPRDITYNPWGQSGRQEMMAMRRLLQLRTFTRFA